MIELTGVTVQRGGRILFEDFNLTLPDAGVYAVEGGTGSGKSLLGKLICGMLHPQRGLVRIDGIALHRPFQLNSPPLWYVDALVPVPGGQRVEDYLRSVVFNGGGGHRDVDSALPLIEAGLELQRDTNIEELSSGGLAALQIVLAALVPVRCLVLDGQLNLLDAAIRQASLALFAELRCNPDCFVVFMSDRFAQLPPGTVAAVELAGRLPVRVNESHSAPPPLSSQSRVLRITLAGGRDQHRAYQSGSTYRVLGLLERGIRIEATSELAHVLQELNEAGLDVHAVEWEGTRGSDPGRSPFH